MSKKLTSLDIVELWLQYLKEKQWSQMVDLCQLTWLAGEINTAESFIKNNNDFYDILSYKIIKEDCGAKCLHKYTVEIDTQLGDRIMIANVICEIGPFTPREYGEWGINPISAILKYPLSVIVRKSLR